MRNPPIGRRMEQLESRCLLSLSAFGDQLETDVRQAVTFQQIGGGRATELFSPRLDMAIPQGLPRVQRHDPPNAGAPQDAPPGYDRAGEDLPGDGFDSGGFDSFVPPNDTDKEMPPDGGGQIELGDYGESGSDPGGATPRDAREERESRSVLEMLARLKYPVSTDTAASGVELADPSAPGTDNAALDSVRLDERAVDIAVSELDDELVPAPAPSRAAGESVLNVEVRIDRSAGRYQAFEVLMINPPAGRQDAREAIREPITTPTATNNDLGFAAESPTVTDAESSDLASPVQTTAAVGQPATASGTSPFALLYSLVDEKFSSSWNRAFALVTFGLVAYIFRLQYRLRMQEPPEETIGSAGRNAPVRHSGWFARNFWFASRRRAAASS